MSHKHTATLLIAAACGLAAGPAAAYVGPGAGLSLVGALWALVVALFAAISFVLLWPIRRAMRRRRAQQLQDAAEPAKPAGDQRAP